MSVKELPEGTRCGYGLTHRFSRPSRVGRVAIGYGDGYRRCLSNLSSASIRGIDAPVCGRVSMDQLILDVTDVPDARLGDEVELISPDPASPRSVANLARLAGTIPHEIVCALGGRIRRVLVD
jgi:alanine racemase